MNDPAPRTGDPHREDGPPIGVFDSGLGGLTVVSALRKVLPHESILYFGDTARVPYGPKSSLTIRRFSVEITRFLQGQGVKLVVVACNSATATALDCVEQEFQGPVLGVIAPGVSAALHATRNGRIGVIGTKATINSGAYETAIGEQEPQSRVFSTACPLFVPLAEENLELHPAARLLAQDYLAPLLDQDIDTLILGCTHYPLLKDVITATVGPSVTVVDSAATTASAVSTLLKEEGLANVETFLPGALRCFVSDDPGSLERFQNRIMPGVSCWVGTAKPDELCLQPGVETGPEPGTCA